MLEKGNLLINLSVENNSDEKEKSNTVSKYNPIHSLKKIAKFSKRMKRSTSKTIVLFDKTLNPKMNSQTLTSPTDLLLKMPLIPFWRTSLDIIEDVEEKKYEDTTLRVETLSKSKQVALTNFLGNREITRKTGLDNEDNYLTMKEKYPENEYVMFTKK